MAKAKIYIYKIGEDVSTNGFLGGGISPTTSYAYVTTNTSGLNVRTSNTGIAYNGASTNNSISFNKDIFESLIVEVKSVGFGAGPTEVFITATTTRFPKNKTYVYGTILTSSPTSNKFVYNLNKSTQSLYLNIGHIKTTDSYTSFNMNLGNIYFLTRGDILTINSYIEDTINFSVDNLNIVNILKVDILINNEVVETYTDNLSDVIYKINKELCVIGENNIEVRVVYSQGGNIIDTVSEYFTYNHSVPQLQNTTPLIDVSNTLKTIVKTNIFEYEKLKSILLSKSVNIAEDDKMLDLILKVGNLSKV